MTCYNPTGPRLVRALRLWFVGATLIASLAHTPAVHAQAAVSPGPATTPNVADVPSAPPEAPTSTLPTSTLPASTQPASPLPAAPAAEREADELESSAPAPGDPWGDRGGSKLGPLVFKAMLQARYSTTLAAASDSPRSDYVVREETLARQSDGWRLNRLFLRLGAEPTANLSFKTILDFAELAAGHTASTVKQAYADLHPVGNRVSLLAGIMKLPFSSMELDPIADYELANLGISDDLIKAEGYAGRDVGAEFVVAPLRKPRLLRAMVGAFAGHSQAEHASPLGAVGARIQSEPVKGFSVGGGLVRLPWDLEYRRPFDTSSKDVLPDPPDPFYPTARYWRAGTAAGVDVGMDRWHFRVRAEGLLGDRVDVGNAYGAERFAAAWALVAYRFRAGPVRFMPAVRLEWLDADRERPGGIRKQLSAAWNTLFSKDIKFVLDVTRVQVEDSSPLLDPPKPLQTDPYLELSHTQFTAQLQVQL